MASYSKVAPPYPDLKMLQRIWLSAPDVSRIETYHSKFTGFEDELKKFRKQVSQPIESTTSIALWFALQTHIVQRFNITWKENNTCRVYADLKAYEAIIHDLRDEISFEKY